MKLGTLEVCPLCAWELQGSALSRIDNKTKICSKCGLREAQQPVEVKINKEELERYRKERGNDSLTYGDMWLETREV